MKIVLGLGNPGTQYAGTRHNAGIGLVEVLGSRFQGLGKYGWRKFYGINIFKTAQLVLVKTANYFMNESGNLIRDLARTYNLEPNDLYVAHDDLDLRLGDYKIQKGIGPKLHYGLQSIENQLGHKDFWRIRIGVDNREQGIGSRVQGEEYVLQRFTDEEKVRLNLVLDEIVKTIDSRQTATRQK